MTKTMYKLSMSQITNQLEKAVRIQPTTDNQYLLLKTILDNYPADEELGTKAVELCYSLSKGNFEFADIVSDDLPSLYDSMSFTLLAWDKDPNIEEEEAEEAEEEDYEPEPPLRKSGYAHGHEDQIETLVEFCSYGMDLYDAMKQVGFTPPTNSPNF